MNSFTLVLFLGGAQVSTLEMEIYRLIWFQLDIAGAAALASVQMMVCVAAVVCKVFVIKNRVTAYRLESTRIRPLSPVARWVG